MITVDRIVISGDKTFDNCKIYDISEQANMKVPNIFEDDQLYFVDGLGDKYFVPDYVVTVVEIRNSPILRKALLNKYFVEVSRINIADITHAPAWIIPNKYYNELDMPIIFDGGIQLAFFESHHALYITSDVNVCLIQA